jgi:octopine/nopaline transport system substrate-binding protein
MNKILKINKLLFTIITLLFLTNSAYAAKNDCSVFKKFSKDFFACKAGNLKDGIKNTAGKLKPKSSTNDGAKNLEKAEAKNAKALEKAEAKKLKDAEKNAKALEKAEAKNAKALEKAEAKKLKDAEKKAKALEKAEAKAKATSTKDALKKAKVLEAAEAKKAKEIKKEQAAARAEARKKYKAEVKAYNQAKKPNLKSDKISIGISNSYSPWGFVDGSGKLAGFELELAQELCAIMKRECAITGYDRDGAIPALLMRKFDAVMTGIEVNQERQNAIAFSQTYADGNIASFASLKNSRINTVDLPTTINLNFDQKGVSNVLEALAEELYGKKICVQTGTIYEKFLEAGYVGPTKLKSYKTQKQVNLGLTNGNCDIALAAAASFANYSDKSVTLVGPTLSGGMLGKGVAVGIRKNTYADEKTDFNRTNGKRDARILNDFNDALNKAKKQGIISNLAMKHFGFDASM